MATEFKPEYKSAGRSNNMASMPDLLPPPESYLYGRAMAHTTTTTNIDTMDASWRTHSIEDIGTPISNDIMSSASSSCATPHYGLPPPNAQTDICMGTSSSTDYMIIPPPPSAPSFFNTATSTVSDSTTDMLNEYEPMVSSTGPPPIDAQTSVDDVIAGLRDNEPSDLGVLDNDTIVRAFIELLNDEDEVPVRDVSVVAIEWSMKPEGREAIASSPDFVETLLKCLSKRYVDCTIIHCVAGVLHNISQIPRGQNAILQARGVPVLIATLVSPIESAVVFAITSLHNLLLQLEEAKVQVKAHKGLPPIVDLLQRQICDNPRFFAIVADCLRSLAYQDSESQRIIYQCNGSALLLNALDKCLNNSETDLHPITTLSRALKALSSCRNNKEQIVSARGMYILTKCLDLNNLEIQKIIVWTLRNLSDVATHEKNLDDLLSRLIILINTCGHPSQKTIIECALGTLFNLTCNNEKNKHFLVRLGGLETLIQAIRAWIMEVDVIEPALSTLKHLTSEHIEGATQYLLMEGGISTLIELLNQLVNSGLFFWQKFEQIPFQTWALLKPLCALVKNIIQIGTLNSAQIMHVDELVGSLVRVAQQPQVKRNPEYNQQINDFLRHIQELAYRKKCHF